ncbi:MAG TPA: hypothetical protein PLI43_07455 [Albidovulum sp.]|uniref:hypothetical protein n=1 Tax=Albidovulum sp. TaxID=1872424 RepID=UPI002C7BA073|nr:hypothetical protein [Albidovulum sp.]
MRTPLRIAYVLDPRFPGGTSSAVAAELKVAARFGRITVHAVEGSMFRGRTVAPALETAFDDLGIEPVWDAPVISADLVILHNPAFLKFERQFGARIFCRDLIAVTHENFERPGGVEGFDAAKCLALIDRATLALRKHVAPVSAANRRTLAGWFARQGAPAGWQVLPDDWFNICAFETLPPTATPADRRGRHSRAGFEKFPSLEIMDRCFPAHAGANVILGADGLIAQRLARPHWTLLPFGAKSVEEYFGMIDFMVYFTSPAWRESFGRVLAEAMAAGKVVISDPATAESFGGGVIGAAPDEVDAIVARHVAEPKLYRAQVARGQAAMARFSAEAFAAMFGAVADRAGGRAAA